MKKQKISKEDNYKELWPDLNLEKPIVKINLGENEKTIAEVGIFVDGHTEKYTVPFTKSASAALKIVYNTTEKNRKNWIAG